MENIERIVDKNGKITIIVPNKKYVNNVVLDMYEKAILSKKINEKSEMEGIVYQTKNDGERYKLQFKNNVKILVHLTERREIHPDGHYIKDGYFDNEATRIKPDIETEFARTGKQMVNDNGHDDGKRKNEEEYNIGYLTLEKDIYSHHEAIVAIRRRMKHPELACSCEREIQQAVDGYTSSMQNMKRIAEKTLPELVLEDIAKANRAPREVLRALPDDRKREYLCLLNQAKYLDSLIGTLYSKWEWVEKAGNNGTPELKSEIETINSQKDKLIKAMRFLNAVNDMLDNPINHSRFSIEGIAPEDVGKYVKRMREEIISKEVHNDE